jgi:hypothetical protein
MLARRRPGRSHQRIFLMNIFNNCISWLVPRERQLKGKNPVCHWRYFTKINLRSAMDIYWIEGINVVNGKFISAASYRFLLGTCFWCSSSIESYFQSDQSLTLLPIKIMHWPTKIMPSALRRDESFWRTRLKLLDITNILPISIMWTSREDSIRTGWHVTMQPHRRREKAQGQK